MTALEAKQILLSHRDWLLYPPPESGGRCEQIAEAIEVAVRVIDKQEKLKELFENMKR